MNFETIKTFGSEEPRGRPLSTRRCGDYAGAAVKANTSLQMLNAIQSVVLSLGLLLRHRCWPASR